MRDTMTAGLDNLPSLDEEDDGFRQNYLLFQLAFISHKFSDEFHGYLRAQGVSPAKWRLLVNIFEQPSIRITRLARNTLYEQSRVTKIADQLCLDGLVVKSTGQSDRRRVHLNLTKKGQDILAPLMVQAKQHEVNLLSQLDPDDAKNLKEILAKLIKPHLEDITKKS